MTKSTITALLSIGLLTITGHTLAQIVSNTSNTCPLFISNESKVPAEVGVSNGPNISVNPGAKVKLDTSCTILQKTTTNYSNLVKRELATIGDASATYTMTLKEDSSNQAASSTQAEATTTKLSTDAADYVWVTTTAKICMTGSC